SGAVIGVARLTVIVNQPTANDDFADTDGANAVPIDILENDTDPDGGLLTRSLMIVGGPKHGKVTGDRATGEVTYQARSGFGGTDSFFYRVDDEHGATSNKAQVTVIVHRPKANDDFNTTTQGAEVVLNAIVNDTDPDGALVASSVTPMRQPK